MKLLDKIFKKPTKKGEAIKKRMIKVKRGGLVRYVKDPKKIKMYEMMISRNSWKLVKELEV